MSSQPHEAAKRAILVVLTDDHAELTWEEIAGDCAEVGLAAVEPLIRADERARHQPDESPGAVIAAEPDGTIVLDDSITTWNPRRACEFLLAEQRRSVATTIKAQIDAADARWGLSVRDPAPVVVTELRALLAVVWGLGDTL